jgi:hypothetical protein
MEVSMRLPWLVVALVGLAACDGKILDVGGDDGGAGQSADAGTRDSSSSTTDSTRSSDAVLDTTLSTDTTTPEPGNDGSYQNDTAPTPDAASSGTPYDAGLYYGDGSFFVDGGAYPDTGAITDSAVTVANDAAPGCSALAACCGSLSAANESLCTAIVTLGNAANCSAELQQLQAAGECTGALILASHVQVAPQLLVSDGNLLFWTTTTAPALLAMPVQGGPITILLTGPISNTWSAPFLAVDGVNVYVLANDQLLRIPKKGGGATLVNEGGGVRLKAVTSLGGSAYWLDDASGFVHTVPLLGGPISPVALLQTSNVNVGQMGVTSSAIFVPSNDAGLIDFPRTAQPGGGKILATSCDFVTSDTNAVYCAGSGGSNLTVMNDGTTNVLGPAVNSSPIAFDDTYVYWADETNVGSIMKAPKAGGTATVVAWDTSPTAIAVDANSVYWGDGDGYIKSTPK